MKKWLKTLLVIFTMLGVLAGGLYGLYWNPKADISVSKEVQSFPLTTEQKLEDFNYLYDTLESSFPYFEVKKRQFGTDWLVMYDQFKAQISGTADDLEYYRALVSILNQLQNGHTNIIEPGSHYEDYIELYRGSGPWDQVFSNAEVMKRYQYWKDVVTESAMHYIPILFRYIEGVYVADDGYAGADLEQTRVLKGSVLESVDGVEIDEYIQSLKSQRVLAIDRIRNKPMLKWFAIRAEQEVQLGIRLPDKTKTTIRVSPAEYEPVLSNGDKPEHLYTAEYIDELNTAYLKIPSFSSPYVEKDQKGILDFLQKSARCDALIIDIRGNGGGSTNYWMNNLVPPLTSIKLESEAYLLFRNSEYLKPFMKRKMFFGFHALKPLEQFPHAVDHPEYFENNDGVFKGVTSVINPVNTVAFSGKIYLLVDKYVFSSAEAFAVFAKSTGWATLVGTDTGGDGIGFDPVVVALPHSGLVLRFPCEMGVTPDGKPNEETATEPDIYVEQTYIDYLKKVELLNNGVDINILENRLQYDTILRTVLEQIAQ